MGPPLFMSRFAVAVALGAGLLLGWSAVPLRSSQAGPTFELADRYLAGGYADVTTALAARADLDDLLKDLESGGAAWIERGGAESAPRRRLALATFALEAARIAQTRGWKSESRTPDYLGSARVLEWKAAPLLIEWACRLLRSAGPPTASERLWQLAAMSVAERAGDFEFLHSDGLTLWNPNVEIDHLVHVSARFPAEPRFKLAMGIAATLRPPAVAALLKKPLQARTIFESLLDDVDVGAEAMLRLGVESASRGDDARAIDLFERLERKTRDPWIVYHSRLYKSRSLDRKRRAADATVARAAARAARPEASLDIAEADRELRAADDRFWPPLIERLRGELNVQPADDPAPVPDRLAALLSPRPSSGVTPEWLVAAFDARQEQTMFDELRRTRNLAALIKQVAAVDNPWPDRPRREALFVLAVARAGLRGDRAALDETGRWLTDYDTLIRQPLGADDFECTWYLAEIAALEAVIEPAMTMPFVTRARQRCPGEARLVLAQAVVTDQRWPVAMIAPTPSAPAGSPSSNTVRFLPPTDSQTRAVTAAYEAAVALPAVSVEARVRLARFFHRIGRDARAIELTADMDRAAAEPAVIYFGQLVRGQAFESMGDPAAAAASFRAALLTWPSAQSPRVSLLTLALDRDDLAEAMRLAETVQTAAVTDIDPWWFYWQGDDRVYMAIVERLRRLAR